jgi:tetratricopeptide (TPR) repeat protein
MAADPADKSPPNDVATQSSRQAASGQGHAAPSHRHYNIWWSDPLWLACPPPYWYYYPPPLWLPAETLYGPQALQRFFGPSVSSSAAPVQKRAAEVKKPVERVVNAETRGLAWRFITFGDAHFANNKFSEAYQRYRKAAEIVPELAEAHFRQGFALIGAGRFDAAAKAFRRGLAIEPAWPRSGFRLGDLYVGNPAAKAVHLEALADAAEKDGNNADLLFLLGVFLHFDGQRPRAVPFFERAEQLAGREAVGGSEW